MAGSRTGGRGTTGQGGAGRLTGVALLVLALVVAACGGGGTGGIAAACVTGPRQTADQRALCACIQSAANRTLSAADQRRAAPFFADPDRAHRVRLSDTARDDAFWARYLAFVAEAEAACAPDGQGGTT
ncbi:MAG: hypothetical protein MUF73_10955 [Rhodobacteraceae bacterium]|jgi:hypothetical protein|nr:hypothetical protein [Paracoccaceae bacterium]